MHPMNEAQRDLSNFSSLGQKDMQTIILREGAVPPFANLIITDKNSTNAYYFVVDRALSGHRAR